MESRIHEILYLEGSDVIFKYLKGEKRSFYRSFLDDSQRIVNGPCFPLSFYPSAPREKFDRSSRIVSFPARTGLLPPPPPPPLVFVYQNRYKDPGSFSRDD